MTIDLPSSIDITSQIDSELEVEINIGTLGSTWTKDVEKPPLLKKQWIYENGVVHVFLILKKKI